MLSVNNLSELIIKSDFSGDIFLSESMKNHCTFKTGGPAEIFLLPFSREDIILVRQICSEKNIPLFILGGGANILVSDKGIPGITLCLEKMNHIEVKENLIISQSGLSVNALVEFAYDRELSGLEFLNRLPGSVGGALYMNARCYGSEISDILIWAEYLDENNCVQRFAPKNEDWAYKKSPFQRNDWIILNAAFALKKGDKTPMKETMEKIARDRISKGHFKKPSAGSTFKNNRKFGKPSGQIIDECGFKGREKGGAAIASWHGNIFINKNKAHSQDISDLIYEVQKGVEEKTGFHLEPEVLLVGDWS